MNSYITKILVFKNIAVHYAVAFLGSKLIPMKKSFIMCQQALADPILGTRAPRSIFFIFMQFLGEILPGFATEKPHSEVNCKTFALMCLYYLLKCYGDGFL